MHTIYLGFGANLGEPKTQILQAIAFLEEGGCLLQMHSEFLVNPPMSEIAQEDYVNSVGEFQTQLGVDELIDLIESIIQKFPEKQKLVNGPRYIDIDLLFYDEMIGESKGWHIPHIGIEFRDFVLLPMMEIAPEKVHPKLKKTMVDLYLDLGE